MPARIILCTIAALTISVVGISSAEGDEKKPKHSKSDAQVVKAIIKESIDGYPGNCPCPYNVTRNGSRCGGRSAWSRAGGYSPVCYESDVTKEMIVDWRERHADSSN